MSLKEHTGRSIGPGARLYAALMSGGTAGAGTSGTPNWPLPNDIGLTGIYRSPRCSRRRDAGWNWSCGRGRSSVWLAQQASRCTGWTSRPSRCSGRRSPGSRGRRPVPLRRRRPGRQPAGGPADVVVSSLLGTTAGGSTTARLAPAGCWRSARSFQTLQGRPANCSRRSPHDGLIGSGEGDGTAWLLAVGWTGDGEPQNRNRWLLVAVSTAFFCVSDRLFRGESHAARAGRRSGSTTTDMQWVVSIYATVLGRVRRCPQAAWATSWGAGPRCWPGSRVVRRRVHPVPSRRPPVRSSPSALQGTRRRTDRFPVSVSVLTSTFPALNHPERAIGTAYGIARVWATAGPLVGDLLITVGWRACFCFHWSVTPWSRCWAPGPISASFDQACRPHRCAGLAGRHRCRTVRGRSTGPVWAGCRPRPSAPRYGRGRPAIYRLVENQVRWPLVELSLFRNPTFAMLVVAGHRRQHCLCGIGLSLDDEPAAECAGWTRCWPG